MHKVKKRGGARVGTASATWPFASLTVTRDKFQLNATILGNYVFKPGDIISITPLNGPLQKGLKIDHKVPGFNSTIIFWTLNNPSNLMREIEMTGFLSNSDPIDTDREQEMNSLQEKGGFPIKTSAAIVIFVVWNLLFIWNFFTFKESATFMGLGAQLALGFVLLTCILLLTFEPVRKLILKEGRKVQDFRIAIYFLIFIIGSMFLVSILVP